MGRPARPGGGQEGPAVVDEVATAHGVAPSQVALAWLLARSPTMLPIPGTGSVTHLEENATAATLELAPGELVAIAAATSRG